jgi:hypothetical protein
MRDRHQSVGGEGREGRRRAMKKWLFVTLALMVWTAAAAQGVMGVPVATDVEGVNVKLFAPSAWGLHDVITDPNDAIGRFDIKRALIDVSGSPRVAVFSITMFHRWRARLLHRRGGMQAWFDSRRGRTWDYTVNINSVLDRNTIICDLGRRQGSHPVESEEATKRAKRVTCSFHWRNIRPTRRVRWNVGAWIESDYMSDCAPDSGMHTI